MNSPTLTVGIAAYNAEHNILALLDALASQNGFGYRLQKILVSDDCSADRTAELVANRQSAPDSLVRLVQGTERGGFGRAVYQLLTRSSSDITLLLNDDIIITSPDFLQKTVATFGESERIGLVCANPRPDSPANFVERAVYSSFSAYDRARRHIRQGHSALTCDGKTMAFSRHMIQMLEFPDDFSQMGNVDTYMYCMCIQNGFEYRFVPEATVAFKNPSTVADLTRWTLRNNDSLARMRREFGHLLDQDYQRLRRFFTFYKISEFVHNPLGCLLLFMVTIYCSLFLKLAHGKFNTTWNVVTSTKTIAKTTNG